MNSQYDNIQQLGNVFFTKEKCIPHELFEFAHIFVNRLRNYQRIDGVQSEQIEHIFDIRSVGMIKDKIKLEHNNGRLYVFINGIEHLMEHEKLGNTIIEKMYASKEVEDVIYEPLTTIQRLNLERIKTGNPPVTFLSYNSNKFKFKLILAFTQLCEMNRVPYTASSLRNFIYQDFVYTHYTHDFKKKLLKETKSITISNYHETSYDDMEKALSFLIYLNKKNKRIRSSIIYNQLRSIYTVCYDYYKPEQLDTQPNQIKMKRRFLTHIHPDYNRDLENKDITELFDYSNVRDYVTHPNLLHIHHDGDALPLTYHEKYRHYNHNFKNAINFDRQNTVIKHSDVKIMFRKGIITINDVIIIQDVFCIDSKKNDLLNYVYYLWSKGYFLTVYGHIYYNETNNIIPLTITTPKWFTVKNSSIGNLLKFLKFNFPEVLAMAAMS